MNYTTNEIVDISNRVAAKSIPEILDIISSRLEELTGEKPLDKLSNIEIYGQIVQWLLMDYIDRAIDDKFFDKKLEFIMFMSIKIVEMLNMREQERSKKFDD